MIAKKTELTINKVKKTNGEVQSFRAIAERYIASTVAKDTIDNLKLKFALKKLLNKTKKINSVYQSAVEEKRLDNCMIDPKTEEVLRDSKDGFRFTSSALKVLSKNITEIADKEVEIEAHFVKIPKDFPFNVIEHFEGFVFQELTEDSVLEMIK
jgi:hypothetical protein